MIKKGDIVTTTFFGKTEEMVVEKIEDNDFSQSRVTVYARRDNNQLLDADLAWFEKVEEKSCEFCFGLGYNVEGIVCQKCNNIYD